MENFSLTGVNDILKGFPNLDPKRMFNTCCSSKNGNLSSSSISNSKSIIQNQGSFVIRQATKFAKSNN